MINVFESSILNTFFAVFPLLKPPAGLTENVEYFLWGDRILTALLSSLWPFKDKDDMDL